MGDFKNTTILVTGGAGFVGSNLTQALLQNDVERIHIVDNLLSAERENIPEDSRILFSEASIADDGLLQNLKDEYDYIFHLATYHGNQSSIHDPLADHENNTLTTIKLYERIKNFKKTKKVVYSSAGCAVAEKTFEDVRPTLETEVVSLWADSPYSMSKIFGEFYSNYFFKQHALPVTRARFQNVYGPGEILGAGKWRGTAATVWRNVVPTFVYKALKREPLPVENKGMATRDFIYVADIVRGLMLLALKGTPGEVYNLATGREVSILELAETINQLTASPCGMMFLPKRDWDNSGKRFGGPEKAFRQLGFKALTALDDGLRETIEWTRSRTDFIERVMSKHLRRNCFYAGSV